MVRRQASLGSEFRRVYGEGKRMDMIMIATVINVNYRYNTVDIKLRDNTIIMNSGNQEGKYSAPMPIAFGGRTVEGKPYGQTIPLTVGSTVLVGFEDKSSTRPLILSVYSDPEDAKELSRSPFANTQADNKNLRGYMNQNFTVYPNLTYENIDGVGNRTTSFNGKSFMVFDSDIAQAASSITDNNLGTRYEDLSTSYYYSGELIEPVNSKAPAILFKHQGNLNIPGDPEGGADDHKFMVFLSQDGTYRTSTMREGEDWRSFYELNKDGQFTVKYQRDTKSLGLSEDFVEFSVGDKGIEMRAGDKYFLFNEDGTSGNVSFGGGGSGGGGTTIVEADLSEVGEKLDGLDEKILNMKTEFTQTAEKIKLAADMTTLLENSIKSYQAELVIMARQIYSGVKSTEISGKVFESLQSLGQQILVVADRNKHMIGIIDMIIEDGSLDPLEKMEINDMWLAIKAEYTGFTKQAESVEANYSNYTAKYKSLEEYLPPLLSDSKSGTQIVKVTFKQKFVDYLNARLSLLQNIMETLKAQIEQVTQKAVSAAGDTGDAFMKVSLATLDAMDMLKLLNMIVGDNELSAEDKQKLYPRYLAILDEGKTARDQASIYGISSIAIEATLQELRRVLEEPFKNMKNPSRVDGIALISTFNDYYNQYITIYEEITEQTKVVLDNFAGDVLDYSSLIVQTDKRISVLLQSVEIQGAQVRTSRAYMELQANRFLITISGNSYDRNLEEILNTMNSGGRNLFSLETSTPGVLADDDGKVIPSDKNGRVSDYIVIPTNTDFVSSVFNNKELNNVKSAYFDERKNYLITDSVSDSSEEIHMPTRSPHTARYVRVSAEHLDTAKFQFEIGSKWTFYKPSPRDTIRNVTIARQYRDQTKATMEAKESWKNEMNAQYLQGIGEIEAISEDGRLTVADKVILKRHINAIEDAHPYVLSECNTYNISKIIIESSLLTLQSFVGDLLTNMTEESTVSQFNLKGFFTDYYTERNEIAKKVADYATKSYTEAEKTLAAATKSANEAERLKNQLVQDAQAAARSVSTVRTLIVQEEAYRKTVMEDLNRIASDDLLTDMEKVLVRDYMSNVESESNWYITQANVYSISTARYTSALNQLKSYIEPMLTMDKLMEVTNINKGTFITSFTDYFQNKSSLLDDILLGALGVLSAAESAADEASNQALLKDEEYVKYINEINDAHEAIVKINKNIDELTNSISYVTRLESSNGTIFMPTIPETTLTARLFRGTVEVTDNLPKDYFEWTKRNLDKTLDIEWNLSKVGVGNTIKVTHEELDTKAEITVNIFQDD